MNNEKSIVNEAMEQRLAMKQRMDDAMIAGRLTIEVLMQIPPTTTSIEHHITLMNHLKAERKLHPALTATAAAFMAPTEQLLEQIYADEPEQGQLAA